MRTHVLIASLAFGLVATAQAEVDVGLSVSVSQPGLYGRIDIGDFSAPPVIFPQPVVITPVVGVAPPPVYMHVPPGHAKKWSKYCGRYNACGRPVFFVQEHWYNDVYVPARHGKKHHKHDRDHDHDHDHGKGGKGGKDKGGKGNGHGKGH